MFPAQKEFGERFRELISKLPFEQQMEIIYLFREVAARNLGDDKAADELAVATIRSLGGEHEKAAIQIFLNCHKAVCSSGFQPPGCGQLDNGETKHHNLIVCQTPGCQSYGRSFRECVGHDCQG